MKCGLHYLLVEDECFLRCVGQASLPFLSLRPSQLCTGVVISCGGNVAYWKAISH